MQDAIGWLAGMVLSIAFGPALYLFGTSRIKTIEEARAWIMVLAYACLVLLLGLAFGWPH